MNYRKLIFPGFILMVLVQLYVPAQMILGREDVIESGVAYKFKTRPFDPNDPFRGKYIRLSFEEERVVVDTTLKWISGEDVYAILGTHENGFAKIKGLSKVAPTGDQDYIKTTVRYSNYSSNSVRITLPFDRFYMEESKAYDAEVLSRVSFRDTSKLVYALVNVKEGEAVMSNVFIDDVPISEAVKQKQKMDKEIPSSK